jgi:hypothetical protein
MTDVTYSLFNAKTVRQTLRAVVVKVVKTPFIYLLNDKKNYARAYEMDNTFLIRVKGFVQDSMSLKIRLPI